MISSIIGGVIGIVSVIQSAKAHTKHSIPYGMKETKVKDAPLTPAFRKDTKLKARHILWALIGTILIIFKLMEL